MSKEQLMTFSELDSALEQDAKEFALLQIVKAGSYESAAAKYRHDDMMGVYARILASRIYRTWPEWAARRLWPGTKEWMNWWKAHPEDQAGMAETAKRLEGGKNELPYEQPRKVGRTK